MEREGDRGGGRGGRGGGGGGSEGTTLKCEFSYKVGFVSDGLGVLAGMPLDGAFIVNALRRRPSVFVFFIEEMTVINKN